VPPARWAVAAVATCAPAQHGPCSVRCLRMTSDAAAVQQQCCGAAQKLPSLALLCCAGGGPPVWTQWAEHARAEAWASFLFAWLCGAGHMLGACQRRERGHGACKALTSAVRGLRAQRHSGGRRCAARWASAEDNSESNGKVVSVTTAQGRALSLFQSFALHPMGLSLSLFSGQRDLHFICRVTSPSPAHSAGERSAQLRKHRRNLLEPIWGSL